MDSKNRFRSESISLNSHRKEFAERYDSTEFDHDMRSASVGHSRCSETNGYMNDTNPRAISAASSQPSKACILCRQFCERTSIRGAKAIVSSEYKFLRFFWAFFVLFSMCLLLAVGIFHAQLFFQYRTLMDVSQRTLSGGDFPALTVCTNGIMGTNGNNSRFLRYPPLYSNMIRNISLDMLKRRDFDMLNKVRELDTSVMFHVNNFHIWKTLSSHLHNRNSLTGITGREYKFCRLNGLNTTCDVESAFDMQFHTCLRYTVPPSERNQAVQEMSIVMGVSFPKAPFFFSNDINRLKNNINQIALNVFLHRPGTLPDSQPTYIMNIGTHTTLTIDFDAVETNHLSRPDAQCKNPMTVKHANYKLNLPVNACDKYHRLQLVRDICNCDAWWNPMQKFDHEKNNTLCGYMQSRSIEDVARELECMQRVSATDLHEDSRSHCGTPCQIITYSPRYYANELSDLYTNTLIRNFLLEFEMDYLKGNCSNQDTNLSKICLESEKSVYLSYTNGTPEEIKQRLLAHLSPLNVHTNYNVTPFPPDPQAAKPWNYTTEESQVVLQMVLRSSSQSVYVQTERFVLSPLSVTVQFLGACSFLAGITFGVLGEFVDIVYRAIRMQATKAFGKAQEAPTTSNQF